jgi:protein O-mannosyl-transferase
MAEDDRGAIAGGPDRGAAQEGFGQGQPPVVPAFPPNAGHRPGLRSAEPSSAPGPVPPPPEEVAPAFFSAHLAPPSRRPSWLPPSVLSSILAWGRARFLGADPTLWSALAPFTAIVVVIFSRWPGTNYIFDEQEALLANPYVNATGGLRYVDAIHRDFWGLPPDRSIGSYRPLPDLLWRALWSLSSKSDGLFRQPFIHHIYNVLFHGLNAALVTAIVFAWTRRRGQAYLAGACFAACAVLTEAVSGIVGIADVLGGMGALLALYALSLPAWAMPFSVFTAVAFGLFSKESALVCVPLVPFAALLAAPLTHPARPARVMRAILAFVGAAAAFYLYVELRKKWFPSPLPRELADDLPDDAPRLTRFVHEFLVWFHQAPLPKDPLNNPLVDADKLHRVAAALRVYFRGLVQIVFPSPLSGDYSFPQEPIPPRLVFPESVAGAALTVLPLIGSAVLWLWAMLRERGARITARVGMERWGRSAGDDDGHTTLRITGLVILLAALSVAAVDVVVFQKRGVTIPYTSFPLWIAAAPLLVLGTGVLVEGLPPLPRPATLRFSGLILVGVGITWIVVSYFPHSNIPVVLPTVRAERFWYFPAIGSSMVLAVFFSWLHRKGTDGGVPLLAPVVVTGFLLFQGVQAYRHAMDYRSDLDFWEATKDAVPRSAKAHLNYSVMKGARGDLATRLSESEIAMELAPSWPMAHIYTGDTLCRQHKAAEAWPHYAKGFDLGPNDMSLIALALQCLYDEKELVSHEEELKAVAAAHEGSWIAYLATDTLANYEKNKGVDPKYRPRGYNEGPKE